MLSVCRRLPWALALVLGAAPLFGGTASFGYRKQITIDSNKVMGAINHINFPVLVSLVDLDLRTTGNGGRVVNSQGYDIVFTASDGTTRLDFEIETYDPVSGTLVAWVKVPTLQVASSTILDLYYGSGDIFSPQETTTATWSEDYVGVWHLDESGQGQAGEYQDSSPFANHGLGGNGSANHLPSRVTGKVGFGQYFDRTYRLGNATIAPASTTVTFAGCGGCLPNNIQAGDTLVIDPGGGNQETFTVASRLSATQVSVTTPAALNHAGEAYVLYDVDPNNDMINVGDDPDLDLTGNQITVEAWIQHDITPANSRYFGILNHKGFSQGYRFLFPQNTLSLEFSLPAGSVTTAAPVSANTWHHVVATYDGATMRIYVDGVKDVNETARAGNIQSAPPSQNDTWIGHGDQPVDKTWSYPWEGFLDEVRISRVARSGDWILTQHNNQSSPGTFYAVGAETPGSYPLATFDVNLRSIGTGGVLYSTGLASLPLGSRTVSFSGASLPANVGVGDKIILDPLGLNEETLFVTSRDSATEVTLQTRATKNHANETYRIERAYGALQAWEDDRDGNLVAENRREVGVVYKDGDLTGILNINNSTTDSARFMTLTVAPGHRHTGVAGTGAVLRPAVAGDPIGVYDNYTRIEWLEITGWPGASNDAVFISADQVLVRSLIVHDGGDAQSDGIRLFESAGNWTATVENTIAYNIGRACYHVPNDTGPFTLTFKLENVTAYNCGTGGGTRNGGVSICQTATNVTRAYARNVLAVGNVGADFRVNGFASCDGTPSWTISDANISSDTTAPGPNSLTLRAAANQFVSTTPTAENLHLKAGSDAIDFGQVSLRFYDDIDGTLRRATSLWDVGADEFGATTAVDLVRFEARGLSGEAEIEWETASELDNLGFHLYRATSPGGPFQRVTSELVGGLGSSPEGGRYRFRDRGLVDGRTYYYELEDLDTRGVATRHGPVPATPSAEAVLEPEQSPAPEGSWWSFGEPERTNVLLSRPTADSAVVVLETNGFTVAYEDDGAPRIQVPGFEGEVLPLRRVSVEGLAGRDVEIVSVEALDVLRFSRLVPGGFSEDVVAGSSGAVRIRRSRSAKAKERIDGDWAKLSQVGYQGDVKKALLELNPFQVRGDSSELLFARRIVVRLSFRKPDRDASARPARRSRSGFENAAEKTVAVRLAARAPGLYAVGYEEIFGRGRSRSPGASVRLRRQGRDVPFRIEPGGGIKLRPGTRLFFLSEGASLNPYGGEAVYEVELGGQGAPMSPARLPGGKDEILRLRHTLSFEENRYYQAGLLDAPDLWLWDLLFAGSTKSYPFTVADLASSSESASLSIRLQGASDLPQDPDHHLRVFVNGTYLGEASWDGKAAKSLTLPVSPGVLRPGENALELENAGDTGAAYSLVMLDGFDVTFEKLPVARAGVLAGEAERDGLVSASGFASGGLVIDATSMEWVASVTRVPGGIRFPVTAGHRIVAVADEAVLRPEVRIASASRLQSASGSVDYVALAPRELSSSLGPLLERRREQGLSVRSIAVEDVYDELGFGETTPEAVHRLVKLAYHEWGARYILLVGDGTYDFKDYLGTGKKNLLPPRMQRTSYLWTASDPSYGAVHGDDILPDVAIGRLPAANTAELDAMVEKILEHERRGAGLLERVVLVADDADRAGDFPADADDVAATILAGSSPKRIYLGELGVGRAREEIRRTFDDGASIVSYLGHGGIHLWADENLLDLSAVDELAPQLQTPLLLTMNCLNGYFHFPYFDSLSEKLLKSEGRGVVAAFSPSGLSLNGAAHRFHKLLLAEILEGGHDRLGDAVLKAQQAYVDSGALPELVTIYHLLGDPALAIR